MSATIEVKLSGDAEALLQRLGDTAGALQAAARAMDLENEYTTDEIREKYLSFPKDGPASGIGLRVQSGLLRDSLRATRTVVTGTGLTSSIGSSVKYAAIHEFGGKTPAHEIRGKNGGKLRFVIGGRVIFRRSVKHPGSTMPERGMVRRGIREHLPETSAAMSAAIVAFWKQGGAA